MTGPDLRSALAEQVRQRGADPESQKERAAELGVTRTACSMYETDARPWPTWLYVWLEFPETRDRIRELNASSRAAPAA